MNRVYSKWTLIFLVSFFSIVIIKSRPENILSWDAYGHYLYLPAAFIHHDLYMEDFAPIQKGIDEYQNLSNFYVANEIEGGKKVIRYPIGFSILMSPFFFGADVVCAMTSYPQDGFSKPYQWGVIIGCLSYVLIGFCFLRLVLLKWFSEKLTSVLMLLMAFGTNFYFMVTMGQGMVHGVLFGFYAALLFVTISWHEKPTFLKSLSLGFILGLMCLTRASEILAVLIPLLWNVNSWKTFISKLNFLKSNFKKLLLVLLVFIICGLPQLLYWKAGVGTWFYDSYNNPGEGFDLFPPHTLDYLFSYRRGWFLYSPLMLLSCIGLFFMSSKKENSLSLKTFGLLNILLLSSWTCWWYGASFGQRSIVQMYPVYIVGLGFLLQKVRGISWQYFSLITMIGVFILLNLFQTWQFHQGIIHNSRMTKEAYWAVFFKTENPKNIEDLWLLDEMKGADFYVSQKDKYKARIVFSDGLNSAEYLSEISNTCCGAFYSSTDAPYSKDIDVPFSEINDDVYTILEVKAKFYFEGNPEVIKPSLACIITHKGEAYSFQYLSSDKSEMKSNEWNEVSMRYICPYIRSQDDKLNFYAWLQGEGEFYVDDIEVWTYEKKN